MDSSNIQKSLSMLSLLVNIYTMNTCSSLTTPWLKYFNQLIFSIENCHIVIIINCIGYISFTLSRLIQYIQVLHPYYYNQNSRIFCHYIIAVNKLKFNQTTLQNMHLSKMIIYCGNEDNE